MQLQPKNPLTNGEVLGGDPPKDVAHYTEARVLGDELLVRLVVVQHRRHQVDCVQQQGWYTTFGWSLGVYLRNRKPNQRRIRKTKSKTRKHRK